MTGQTTAELCLAAGEVLKDYLEELKALRAHASDPKQIAFLEYQIESIPAAMFLLGAAAGRDSLRRKLGVDGLADFDKEQG